MNTKYLKTITYELTGLKLKIHDNYNKTCFRVYHKNKGCCIIFSKKYIDDTDSGELQRRGYNKKYKYIQILLHEIAHYKQYKKRGLERLRTEYRNDSDYFEKQTDRYALRYYKNLI